MKFEILDLLKPLEVYSASVYQRSDTDSCYNIECGQIYSSVSFYRSNLSKPRLFFHVYFDDEIMIKKDFVLDGDEISKLKEIIDDLRFLLHSYEFKSFASSFKKVKQLSIYDMSMQLYYSRNGCNIFAAKEMEEAAHTDCLNQASNFILRKLGCHRYKGIEARFRPLYRLMIYVAIDKDEAKLEEGVYNCIYAQYDELQEIISDWLAGKKAYNDIGKFDSIDFEKISFSISELKSIDVYA